jgi:hypothetical protein
MQRVEGNKIEFRAEQSEKFFPYKEENGTGYFRYGEWNEQISEEGAERKLFKLWLCPA